MPGNYFVRRWWGDQIKNCSPALFDEVLRELDGSDDEHGDVSLRHELGWSLLLLRSGRLILENVETGDAFYIKKCGRDEVAGLWLLLAEGKVAEVRKLPWMVGYGNEQSQ